MFHKLLLCVQGFFANFVGSNLFSECQISPVILWEKKKGRKILEYFQPSVVVPNHINCICSVCLPECNKKQIFFIMFQTELASSQSLSFFICSFILYKIVEEPSLERISKDLVQPFLSVLFKHMELYCFCILFLLGEEALKTFETVILGG